MLPEVNNNGKIKFLAGGFFPLLAAGILAKLWQPPKALGALEAETSSLRVCLRFVGHALLGPGTSFSFPPSLCLSTFPTHVTVTAAGCSTLLLGNCRAELQNQQTAVLLQGWVCAPTQRILTFEHGTVLAMGWGGGEGRPWESDSSIIEGWEVPAAKTQSASSLFPPPKPGLQMSL